MHTRWLVKLLAAKPVSVVFQPLVQSLFLNFTSSSIQHAAFEVKAVTEAAHKLDIRVVAEGVETEDDLRFCVEIGVDLAQGYFLARPAETAPPVSAEALRILEECCDCAIPVNA
jgi:EAL domain-containing protein (putative c-di-GMP-specific phosphodiesterase class I)